MLDLELIVNVMVGIFTYKAIIGLIKVTCIELLVALLGKEKYNRYERMRKHKAENNPSELL